MMHFLAQTFRGPHIETRSDGLGRPITSATNESSPRRVHRGGRQNQIGVMKYLTRGLLAVSIGWFVSGSLAQTATGQPYKVLDTVQTMGSGGVDYVYAENAGR